MALVPELFPLAIIGL